MKPPADLPQSLKDAPWSVSWSGENAFRLQPSTEFPGHAELDQRQDPGAGAPQFAMIHVTSIKRELAFRTSLLFQLATTTLTTLAALTTIGIVYTRTTTLGGWNREESIVLLGTWMIAGGILATFIEPNVLWFSVQVKSGKLEPEDITEAVISDHLWTRNVPDPDLMIRTSGEMRISNFLLWQLSYAELVITPTLWPDFKKPQFVAALEEYAKRHRRFGGV